jgi:uncharacterized protein (TIGR03435 family)
MPAAPRCVALLLSLSGAAFAQDRTRLKFEVASVKPADRNQDAPPIMRGGPGTSDPERITWEQLSLARLLCRLYALDFDQVTGPSWLGTERYTFIVNLPPGTTKEQLKPMWEDLLAERFHLKTHIIHKDFPVYELSVAKGGPKFHQEPGFPEPRPGEKWAMKPAPRDIRLAFRDATMADFIQRLGWPLSTANVTSGTLSLGRVVDKTGLDGSYSFTLEFAGAWGPGGAFLPPPEGQTDPAPTLFDALRQQLGLKLEEKKAPLDVLVVDHADRVPTEN